MTPRLIHPETLVREFPQPAVFQVPDPLLAPAPAAVQDVEPVGMAGAVGDKGALHDLECVDLPLQLPGVDQAPQDESG